MAANDRQDGHKRGRLLERLAVALLSNATIADAAKAAGVGERTARRWMQQPAFRQVYQAARQQVLTQATGRLQQASAVAVTALVDLLGSTSDAVRVAAARTILAESWRSAESVDLLERVAELEERQQASGRRPVPAQPAPHALAAEHERSVHDGLAVPEADGRVAEEFGGSAPGV